MHLAVTVDTLLVVDVLSLQPLQIASQVSRQGRVPMDFVTLDDLCHLDVSDLYSFVGHHLSDTKDFICIGFGGHFILAGPGPGAGMTNSTRLRIDASLVSDPGARGLGFLQALTLRIDRFGVRHFLSPFAVESPSVSSMTSASTTSSSSADLVGPSDEGPSLDSAGDTPESSLSASLRSFSAASTASRPSAGILSALSARNFSVE